MISKQLGFCILCMSFVTLLSADEVKPSAVKTETSSAVKTEQNSSAAVSLSKTDLEQLQTGLKAYIEAFNSKDAQKLSEHWSENGTFTTPAGGTFSGRTEIRDAFKKYFENQTDQVRLEISDPQYKVISPSVVKESGYSLLFKGTSEPDQSYYEAYYVKENQVWKLDSVQEQDENPNHAGREQLKALSWLIGDWVDEETGDQLTVYSSNRWSLNRNFIRSNFVISSSEGPVLTGVQVIGWDPVAQTIRSWVFDSNGGFGGGAWAEGEGKWSVRSLFVTAEGEKASAINIYRPVDENQFIYESVGRQRGAELLPSIKKNIVRRQEETTN